MKAPHAEFVAWTASNPDAVRDCAGEIEIVADTLATQLTASQAALQGYGDTLAHSAEHLADDSPLCGLLKAVASLTAETTQAAERNRELKRQLS